jgi:protein O-mannosyl-transferase
MSLGNDFSLNRSDAEISAAHWLTSPIRTYGAAALLALAVMIAYWPARQGGFIFDDELLLIYNPIIKAPDGLYRFWFTKEALDYWPLTNSTFWLEWRLWKWNPTGYHFTNLILHVFNSWLLWAILRKLRIPGAFLAALLFAVHPVNVESVAWISQLKNVLSLCFFLLSILWWLQAEEKRRNESQSSETENRLRRNGTSAVLKTKMDIFSGGWRYSLSLLAFLLAMLSKGSVAILPLVLMLLLWWQFGRITWPDMVRCLPFFVVAAALTLVNLWFQTHGAGEVIRSVTPIQRLLGAGAVIWFYVGKAAAPFDLAFIYPQWNIQPTDLLWWLPLLAALSVTALLVGLRNSRWAPWVRPVLFAWAFFCIALLPVMGFTDVTYMRHSLVADHYQYIAIIGVIALAAAAFSRGFLVAPDGFRRATIGAASALVVGFMYLSWQQSSLYANALILYEDTERKNPNSWLVQSNLGLELSRRGKFQEAIPHLQAALRLNSSCAEAQFHWGNILADQNQPEAAIDHYQQALNIAPNYAYAHYRLGVALEYLEHPAEAEQEYRKTIELQPDIPEAHNSLGLILASRRQFSEAIDQFMQAAKIDPDFLQPYVNWASACAALGRYAEAMQIAQQALELAQSKDDAKAVAGITARLKFYKNRLTKPAEQSAGNAGSAGEK